MPVRPSLSQTPFLPRLRVHVCTPHPGSPWGWGGGRLARAPGAGAPCSWLPLCAGEERGVSSRRPASVGRNGPQSFAFLIILLGSRVQIPP